MSDANFVQIISRCLPRMTDMAASTAVTSPGIVGDPELFSAMIIGHSIKYGSESRGHNPLAAMALARDDYLVTKPRK